ncbi:MAG: transglutaminase domain-containing protein [Mogibacterium sp.]|nr:transglutaminase domain-containing protein [Mogibacterium sp.]
MYDFVTNYLEYRFVRDYNSIEQLPEYAAATRHGDCGIQALLFITMCRIAGIPARWQSGLSARPGSVGEHDWAEFYVPGTGWVYADLSAGCDAAMYGDEAKHNFYFGNQDPFRIPINNAFQENFVPPMRYWRSDPYDNQCGEIEDAQHSLHSRELDYRYIEIDIHRIQEGALDLSTERI